jgi:hypothetical protein
MDPMVTMATLIVSRGRSRRRLELSDGAGVLRVTTNASIPCKIWTTRRSWRRAGERKRGWRIEGEEWLTDGGVFGGASLQIWRTPAKKFFVLAESRVEEKKEKRGGDRGLFIGGRVLEEGLGLRPGGAMDDAEESRVGEGERG